MSIVIENINEINEILCSNIDHFVDSERSVLAQNIILKLRIFLEAIIIKIFEDDKGIIIDELSYNTALTPALAYIRQTTKYRSLHSFHKLLGGPAHFAERRDAAETLIIKYYRYLLIIKKEMKTRFGLSLLHNLYKFPLNTDHHLDEYYKEISEKIKTVSGPVNPRFNNRYYIYKVKPFFIEEEIYYEVVFSEAEDRANKFNTIVAYTKMDILSNYSVRLEIKDSAINVFGNVVSIFIITGWEVSIRPCEFQNMLSVFNVYKNINQKHVIYKNLMSYLTENNVPMTFILEMDDTTFDEFKNKMITNKNLILHILELLTNARKIIKNEKPGSNILRYLFFRFRNVIIKDQSREFGRYARGLVNSNYKLSNLKLKNEAIPFDEMPIATSLPNHNPRLTDVLRCIPSENREHEFFARSLTNIVEEKRILFVKKDELPFTNIDNLIAVFNNAVRQYQSHREILQYREFLYIRGYEENVVHIIKKLQQYGAAGILNYTNSAKPWIDSNMHIVKSEEKAYALLNLFSESSVVAIYGSAGVGKTTFINSIASFFENSEKMFLANNNPAVDNLKRLVKAPNSKYSTINKFKYKRDEHDENFLFIDEGSTVSDRDMVAVLNKTSARLIVLVGDIFQIEAINYGIWFNIVQYFLSNNAKVELATTHRTSDEKLLKLWKEVRNLTNKDDLENNILELMGQYRYSEELSEDIFRKQSDDEIILCLNYEGLYGVNNINRLLQIRNPERAHEWGIYTFKVGDPILFNDMSSRYGPLLYNNLKGTIHEINQELFGIHFKILLDKAIKEEDLVPGITIAGNHENGNTIINLYIHKSSALDNEDDVGESHLIPFNLAYAVTIHKAQGLEYDAVKIVITNEIEERISHNIFYTAVTRAKRILKVYWSPESRNKVISNLKSLNNPKDAILLSRKRGIKLAKK